MGISHKGGESIKGSSGRGERRLDKGMGLKGGRELVVKGEGVLCYRGSETVCGGLKPGRGVSSGSRGRGRKEGRSVSKDEGAGTSGRGGETNGTDSFIYMRRGARGRREALGGRRKGGGGGGRYVT